MILPSFSVQGTQDGKKPVPRLKGKQRIAFLGTIYSGEANFPADALGKHEMNLNWDFKLFEFSPYFLFHLLAWQMMQSST